MQVLRGVRRVVASDLFRGLSIFAGSLAALLVVFVIRDLSATVARQHRERACWFERTAEVNTIEARIEDVTSQIFVIAIVSQEDNPPELQRLANELDTLSRRLGPAIEAQEEAVKDC